MAKRNHSLFKEESESVSMDKTTNKWVNEWLNKYQKSSSTEITEEIEAPENRPQEPNNSEDLDMGSPSTRFNQNFYAYMDMDELSDIESEDFHGMTVEDMIKLRQVLKRNVFGMTLTEFMETWRLTFGTTLHPFHFRHFDVMFKSLTKVFRLEEIKDEELLKGEGFQFMIHDARGPALPSIAISTTTTTTPVIDITDDKTIPESTQIFWFNEVYECNGYMIYIRDRIHGIKELGFKTNFEFFERLSEVIPISVNEVYNDRRLDPNHRRLNWKPIDKKEEFIAKLIEDKNYAYLQSIQFPNHLEVVKPGDIIAVRPIEDIFSEIKGQTKPVYITSIVSTKKRTSISPKFFGILIDGQFLKLWENMESFYIKENPFLDMYCVPKVFLVTGFVCAAKCPQNGWIRCQVIEILNGNQKIKVKALDFSYNFNAELKYIKLLKKEFAEIPVQTIKFCLNGIQNAKQVKKALNKFRTKRVETPHDELFCQMLSLRNEAIEVIVFETDDLYDYYSMADHLIQQNCGKKTDDYVTPDWNSLFTAVQNYYKLKDNNNNE